MDSLPYRATVFLRPRGLHCGRIELMERNFAQEADAAVWCRVMSEAEPLATGVWMIAESRGGRMLAVTREERFAAAMGFPMAAAQAQVGPEDALTLTTTHLPQPPHFL
jgi:hypothetical protein